MKDEDEASSSCTAAVKFASCIHKCNIFCIWRASLVCSCAFELGNLPTFWLPRR